MNMPPFQILYEHILLNCFAISLNRSTRMPLRVLFAMLIAFQSWAQTHTNLKESIVTLVGTGKYVGQDSTFVANYSEKFALRMQSSVLGQAFRFNATGLESPLTYTPNVAASIGVSFNYKWLGLGVGFKLPESAAENRGETKQIDIQLNSYGYKIGFDAFYQSYKGFYLSNTDRLLGSLSSGSEFYLRPDIGTEAYGVNVYYVFNNKRFSYRSVFVFNERQLRTAGSWLLQASLTQFSATADSAFIPISLQSSISNPDIRDVTRLRFFQAGALGGYGLNVVLNQKWYVSGTVLGGLALIDYRGDAPNVKLGTGNRVGGRALIRGGVGFNDRKWFFGGNVVADIYNLRYSNELSLNFVVGQVRLFVGYRFDWELW